MDIFEGAFLALTEIDNLVSRTLREIASNVELIRGKSDIFFLRGFMHASLLCHINEL